MVVRIVLAVVLAGIAAGIALLAEQRRRRAPTTTPIAVRHDAPVQLHRDDFARPAAPWLVVVFTSSTCGGCAAMATKVAVLESDTVATTEIEFTAHRSLHERYAIDAVPLVVVADAEGVVRRSWFGMVSATDLWAALAELRSPGSTPSGGHCSNHEHDHPDD